MLRNLIEDFIDFTRLDTKNNMNVHKENTKIRDLFDSVSDMFGMQAEEKRLGFFVKISDRVPISFKTDAVRLKQVILNLLSNAMKFTQKGSITIDVSLEKESYQNMEDDKSQEHHMASSLKSKVLRLRNSITPKSKSKSNHLTFALKNN